MRLNTIYPCIQGEGALTGTPMILIRLQGCTVGCSWCDSKETWSAARGTEETATAICDRALGLRTGHEWALITGGEPCEQDLWSLVTRLRSAGFKVALETSGTAPGFRDIQFDWFCLSPKGYVLEDAWAEADEVKWVVCTPADIGRVHEFLERFPKPGRVTSLQPVSLRADITALCVSACSANGWRLSLQTHQLVGLP